MTCRRSLRSEHAFAGGSNGNSGIDRRTRKLLRVYGNRGACHWLRTGESALRNYCHGALYAPIRVIDVRDGRALVNNSCVVDSGDVGGGDVCVADVNPVHVSPANLIWGYINFAGTEGEPSHIFAKAAGTAAEKHY
jgi:hypothetical protein